MDDRTNAVAVLCGICPKERYPQIRKVLLTVFNSTPYMERFKYILGLKFDTAGQTYTINPVSGIFREIECAFKNGEETVNIFLQSPKK